MNIQSSGFFKNYSNILLLLLGIIIGSLVGLFSPDFVVHLKPIGDIFLNLLFTAVIPLIFFAIASAVASIDQGQKLGRILSTMMLVFLMTIIIAAVFTIFCVWLFPLGNQLADTTHANVSLNKGDQESWGERAVSFVTVNEFNQLLSREHMLAFIIFSFLVGIAALRSGAPGEPFRRFLSSGNEVMKNLLVYVMKLAPVGLGAYFAYQVGTVGPQLFGLYAKPMAVYYAGGLVYFFVFFSIYAFIGGGGRGIKLFWRNNILPSLTAISTCSSIAVIPPNLDAAKRIGIQEPVANVVIPLGASLHKNGSSMSSIIKIAVAFALMGKPFMEPGTLLLAIGLTVLVSIVAGGIPNGGYIGEMLMISAYHLPIEAVPAVMIIGTLVDPMATLLNATGDTVAAMIVDRWVKQ
ncbi:MULTISPECIES: dicarboxylate/amino acid:cation symporter [Olivibacter]|jgi:Na+/H+-dicarboxylate symporter|uniref:Dicarboxylate/amino acid:cation symporter n=2 Tax=Olivibacter TaxID=376469 RepID=A0ABV6HS08_9SPHI|nr:MULTISPECIES: dicarboxylate/amino acid:cation symporter [Olivibacter]MCL4639953.1 dicarboxylate/amino acid:cation symporter [Olivibacter sp. UJ_SKK_5.1]MDM8176322.1 dicarboxylate/amino acid:cation symporter [Olivibacter sp. 47]MDX3915710.1 dicarboxylate/amino acid:cation symporter [Pseudosphingobacterium sp.]